MDSKPYTREDVIAWVVEGIKDITEEEIAEMPLDPRESCIFVMTGSKAKNQMLDLMLEVTPYIKEFRPSFIAERSKTNMKGVFVKIRNNTTIVIKDFPEDLELNVKMLREIVTKTDITIMITTDRKDKFKAESIENKMMYVDFP